MAERERGRERESGTYQGAPLRAQRRLLRPKAESHTTRGTMIGPGLCLSARTVHPLAHPMRKPDQPVTVDQSSSQSVSHAAKSVSP